LDRPPGPASDLLDQLERIGPRERLVIRRVLIAKHDSPRREVVELLLRNGQLDAGLFLYATGKIADVVRERIRDSACREHCLQALLDSLLSVEAEDAVRDLALHDERVQRGFVAVGLVEQYEGEIPSVTSRQALGLRSVQRG
jgi:hypothetical protein